MQDTIHNMGVKIKELEDQLKSSSSNSRSRSRSRSGRSISRTQSIDRSTNNQQSKNEVGMMEGKSIKSVSGSGSR